MTTNRKVVFTTRPAHLPTLDCFAIEEERLEAPAAGQLLVEVEHLGAP
jgi:NADPH-dependent curcumin reductase CurA